MQVGGAIVVSEALAVAEALAVGLGDALGVPPVAGGEVGVVVAVADGVTEGRAVAVGLPLVLGTRSHGGRLDPVPNCRSLMICSASLRVEAGMVAATNCCE